MVREALKAADTLATAGIEAEVVDPRTIVPLDAETICASVQKTGRLVCVDEANRTCSIASEISALAAERAFGALKAPILRVARADAPVSASPVLEAYVTPTAEKIVAAVKQTIGAPFGGTNARHAKA